MPKVKRFNKGKRLYCIECGWLKVGTGHNNGCTEIAKWYNKNIIFPKKDEYIIINGKNKEFQVIDVNSNKDERKFSVKINKEEYEREIKLERLQEIIKGYKERCEINEEQARKWRSEEYKKLYNW